MAQVTHPEVLLVDGRRGVLVVDDDRSEMTGKVVVRLDDGRSIEAPASALIEREDGRLFLNWEGSTTTTDTGRADTVVPVVEEELLVTKRRVVTGRVRVGKTVGERRQVVDEPLFRETVEVVHVPVDRVVETIPEIRQEGETIVIPVVEEELVVTRRIRLREEIRVTRIRTEEHRPEEVALRVERATVERIEGDDAARRLPNS